MHTGGLPFSSQSGILPSRPNLPDDPIIPHNGFLTVEEGEKAFMHLLRKAGVDANWTWDQTMRAIITDPLYKALNTLAEKKAAWQKVFSYFSRAYHCLTSVYSTQRI
jgi:pre-mRNA-processing factor 40